MRNLVTPDNELTSIVKEFSELAWDQNHAMNAQQLVNWSEIRAQNAEIFVVATETLKRIDTNSSLVGSTVPTPSIGILMNNVQF